jgi:TetR/AcrR family transcriptional regulator, transcriptional repressor for nem operon
MAMNDTKSQLLDAAALLLQTRGYNGFSFHDLAGAVGIRTASIHYHFPTKANLCQALVTRYQRDFLATLGDAADGNPEERLLHYVGLFRTTLSEGRMCLCGMIGAEVDDVPEVVGQGVREFFIANEKWLTAVYARQGANKSVANVSAKLMLSALEGAMMISRTQNAFATFDEVAELVLSLHQ